MIRQKHPNLEKPKNKKAEFYDFFLQTGGGSTGFHISYSEIYAPQKKREKIKIRIS